MSRVLGILVLLFALLLIVLRLSGRHDEGDGSLSLRQDNHGNVRGELPPRGPSEIARLHEPESSSRRYTDKTNKGQYEVSDSYEGALTRLKEAISDFELENSEVILDEETDERHQIAFSIANPSAEVFAEWLAFRDAQLSELSEKDAQKFSAAWDSLMVKHGRKEYPYRMVYFRIPKVQDESIKVNLNWLESKPDLSGRQLVLKGDTFLEVVKRDESYWSFKHLLTEVGE